jgi:small conductance mechanosensitive channel
VRVAAAIVLVVLGWTLARDLGRWVEPALFRRVDHGTAGTVSFLIRLTFLAVAGLAALRIAGLDPRTLAVGGAITAVVFGLAAQQTLGNLIAGVVLISARPFRIGDRVRLQGGGLAGQLEGTVASLGLLYVTFSQGEDSIMVPNNVVLTSAVVPLREPAAVDLRARLRPDVKPSEVQRLLEVGVKTPVRAEPHISLEEVDSDEVIVRIAATPASDADGPRLADEVLTAIASVTREGDTDERMAARRAPPEDGAADGGLTARREV